VLADLIYIVRQTDLHVSLQVSLLIAAPINTYIVLLRFGRHIWIVDVEVLKTIKFNTILVGAFGIIATTTSKTSFAISLYRVTTSKWMKYYLIAAITTVRVSSQMSTDPRRC
jgi:hypothetical protein